MPGLDLSSVARLVEREMIDIVRITRNVGGKQDDAIDEFTGKRVEVDPEVVYEGKGLLMYVSPDTSDEPEGGGTAGYTRYTLMTPLDECPVLVRNDDVLLVECARDPLLNGTYFYVSTVDSGTFQAVRSAQVEKRDFHGNA